jgi:hypothetical protein
MKLFKLMFGKSKHKLKCIMIDKLCKCENYRDARIPSVIGWHDIVPADKDAVVWRQKSATIGGNKCEMTRVGGKQNGYISKNGFNPHT